MEYQYHPAADILPLMQVEEFEVLKADIEENGQIEPIWLDKSGLIIDGRNRYRACSELGYEPHFKQWHGDDVIAVVRSLNVVRRHLNKTQRACAGVKLKQYYEDDARERQAHGQTTHGKSLQEIFPEATKGQSRDKAGNDLDVSGRYIDAAEKLRGNSPDLFQAMESGDMTLQQASREERKREQKKREEEAVEKAKNEVNETSNDTDLVRFWHITSDQSVIECDAVITDPPYGILNEPWEPERLEEFTREWAERWNESGADLFLIFWSQRYLYDGRMWFDESLPDYEFTQTLVWHYPNNKGPQSRRMFKQTWEPVYFYRRIGSKREIGVGAGEWGDGLNDFDCHVEAVPQSNFKDDKMKQHPAQKPVKAMRWLVNASTHPGELVVDPFMGSGTTGIAASQLGRRFHGIEISDEYRQVAERRLAAYG